MPGNETTYNTEYLPKRDGQLFDVHKAGYLGRYPLFVMLKRSS